MLHAQRWALTPNPRRPPASPPPTDTRNLQPNTGSVKKGLWDILGEIEAPASGAGEGGGAAAAPSIPSPITVTGRQPCESRSEGWELSSGGRREQAGEGCHPATDTHPRGPRGAPRGNPLPPTSRQGRTPRCPSISTRIPGRPRRAQPRGRLFPTCRLFPICFLQELGAPRGTVLTLPPVPEQGPSRPSLLRQRSREQRGPRQDMGCHRPARELALGTPGPASSLSQPMRPHLLPRPSVPPGCGHSP